MKQFEYTIQDANGIHARPAGLLVKAAKTLDSAITLETAAGKSAVATKLMAVMGLGIKQGDTVTVTVGVAMRKPAPPPWRNSSARICK